MYEVTFRLEPVAKGIRGVVTKQLYRTERAAKKACKEANSVEGVSATYKKLF